MNIQKLSVFLIFIVVSCSQGQDKPQEEVQQVTDPYSDSEFLVSFLDSIWIAEQIPIRTRDSVMQVHGPESKEMEPYSEIIRRNHAANIKKIRHLLDTHGWPKKSVIGQQGNHTICNVLQHDDSITREYYLPMMKQAVLDKQLGARFLVRAQDRLATDKGELQIYGGQMKYYPETKSFNVWPVYDPENIDKRRAEIGLGPISEHLMDRFDFEWNLEEQIKRTEEFIKKKNELKE